MQFIEIIKLYKEKIIKTSISLKILLKFKCNIHIHFLNQSKKESKYIKPLKN
jgi:hypothetical protein